MQASALSTWSTRGWPVLASTWFQSIQAKRHVAVLLDLEHHDIAAQGVDGASLQEYGVAGLGSEPC